MFTHKFSDGTLVPPASLKQAGDLMDQLAAFAERLCPEERDAREREIEWKRRGE